MTWDNAHPFTIAQQLNVIDSTATPFTIADDAAARSNDLGRRMRKSDGNALGDLSTIEAAPLIYATSKTSGGGNHQGSGRSQSGGVKAAGAFVGDYLDRRTQARFVSRMPGLLN